MTLNQTRDLDALIAGDWSLRTTLKSALAKIGLVYDDLSPAIWIQPGSLFHLAYESPALRFELIDLFYALISRAVKAPVKNRALLLLDLSIEGITLQEMNQWARAELADKRIRPFGRKKIVKTFRLSPPVIRRLEQLAAQRGCSVTDALEASVLGYADP